jgi:hypothetical protein
MNLPILFAEEFHDIAPPIDYSLVSPWIIFAAVFAALTLLGLIIWLVTQARRRVFPTKSPRERALEKLDRLQEEIETTQAYPFSIRVSDVLRRYVSEQFNLPVTRQTSVEFLSSLANSSTFSQDEKQLLEDFLNRCDLIKFARYEATVADSRLLLDEAVRFVKGGQLATAPV